MWKLFNIIAHSCYPVWLLSLILILPVAYILVTWEAVKEFFKEFKWHHEDLWIYGWSTFSYSRFKKDRAKTKRQYGRK